MENKDGAAEGKYPTEKIMSLLENKGVIQLGGSSGNY